MYSVRGRVHVIPGYDMLGILNNMVPYKSGVADAFDDDYSWYENWLYVNRLFTDKEEEFGIVDEY